MQFSAEEYKLIKHCIEREIVHESDAVNKYWQNYDETNLEALYKLQNKLEFRKDM